MQLKTLALAALSVPPISVQRTRVSGGTPCAARNIAGTVVISSNSTMRGFVSAMYALSVLRVVPPRVARPSRSPDPVFARRASRSAIAAAPTTRIQMNVAIATCSVCVHGASLVKICSAPIRHWTRKSPIAAVRRRAVRRGLPGSRRTIQSAEIKIRPTIPVA